MRSYTTRRSQPMMRSRLRRPTSKSITAVFLPRRARPVAKLALVVVLPTPPLPEVTTTILLMRWVLSSKLQGFHDQAVRHQAHLGRLAEHLGRQRLLGGAEGAGNRQIGR